jgi:hypothetical protein
VFQHHYEGMNMIRARKGFIALLVVACLAAATSASASAAEFHSEALPTKIQGTQTAAHVYKFGETSVTCDLATVEGTLTNKTVIEMTLTPAYANCHFMVGLIKTKVATALNGCFWKVWANGTENIECPRAKSWNSATQAAPGK